MCNLDAEIRLNTEVCPAYLNTAIVDLKTRFTILPLLQTINRLNNQTKKWILNQFSQLF